MKVKDLIVKLQAFDPELDVVCVRYSDYMLMPDEDPQLVLGVRRGGDYIMRDHRRLTEEDRLKLTSYVLFSGN